MTYTSNHDYVDVVLSPTVAVQHDRMTNTATATVSCSASGSMAIRFPGALRVSAQATYQTGVEAEDPHVHPESKSLPLTVQISTPDGEQFTADHVSLEDLERFRDLRGASQGTWSYAVHGQSDAIPVSPTKGNVEAVGGSLSVSVEETIATQSAPPLVSGQVSAGDYHRFTFDLYRVGTFVATARPNDFLGSLGTEKIVKLFDPDGTEVASGDNGSLTFPVPLELLEKSRDAYGNERRWSLDVFPSPGSAEVAVWASVIAATRIHRQTVMDRITYLIGADGGKISIYGDMQQEEQRLLARLKINDEYSAETIDILGLLYPILKRVPQDPGVDISETKVNVPYILASRSRDLPYDMHVSLDNVKIETIDFNVGASENIQPPIPSVRLTLHVEGTATVKLGGFPLAVISVSNNTISLEGGVRLNADGSFSAETWMNDDPLDIDLSWETAVAAGVVSLGLLTLGAEGAANLIESAFNDGIVQRFHDILGSVMSQIPVVLAMIQGGYYTCESMGLDGDDIVFDYIAPQEPEPKPAQNYLGIIGRSAVQVGPDFWRITPRSLGNTWSADNLNKVDHIVMVMMENRSFDHVLGYRAAPPNAQNDDGLTEELLYFLGQQGFPIAQLNQSAIVPPTKFPADPGHSFSDVADQLSGQLTDWTGRMINSPQGFVANFAARASSPLTPDDVLGYYTGDDLPFTRFLADNYAYSETYFSAHPGPTLPNRMFWLAGDVQYERTGEAILTDSTSENFSLSRAESIFDVLTRKGISWRVYESFPSVAMLRMFARYATDDTQIVPISRLRQDATRGDLPAVTAVEPAMHHGPENDDHPPADLHAGQHFLADVYDALRSNDALWQKTMLIVIYDEHGGFYDHVIPPIAEIRTRRLGTAGDGPVTPPTLVTSYGVRVPAFVVSPWAPSGKGPELVLDHCSILKTILARFCGQSRPFISDRVNVSQTLDAYLSESVPRMNVPAPPALAPLPSQGKPEQRPRILGRPVSRKRLRNGDVDFHELGGMLARLLGRQDTG